MKSCIAVFLLLSALAAAGQSQPPPSPRDVWAGWQPFLGVWVGSGNGQPGQGSGEFSLKVELQGAVLVRRNYAEYPASKDKPAYRHDDLMLIYSEANRTRADYWDNEGHVIHYGVEAGAGKLVFLSDAAQAGPRYRLTYVKTGADMLTLTFEIAPPNDREAFKTYITAEAKRKP